MQTQRNWRKQNGFRAVIGMTSVVVGMVLSSAACSGSFDVVEPQLDAQGRMVGEGNIALSVSPTSVIAKRVTTPTVEWVDFDVTLRIENEGSGGALVRHCSHGLERLEGTTWRPVYHPVCDLMLRLPDTLQAGEIRNLPMRFSAALSGNGGPAWEAASVPGRYRVTFGFTLLPIQKWMDSRKAPVWYSNEFTITELQ